MARPQVGAKCPISAVRPRASDLARDVLIVASMMSNYRRCHVLPVLFAAALAPLAAACTESPPKMVAVANQTTAAHQVTFGATAFGTVAAQTTSDYLEVDDGEQVVLVDGRRMWNDSLGSDNVGGAWTFYLQSVGEQLIVGVSSDE